MLYVLHPFVTYLLTLPRKCSQPPPVGRGQSRHQLEFSINILAGTVGGCLVGPHVCSRRLTGNHCRDFLLIELPDLPADSSSEET
jgi:hypothetical protein